MRLTGPYFRGTTEWFDGHGPVRLRTGEVLRRVFEINDLRRAMSREERGRCGAFYFHQEWRHHFYPDQRY